MISAKINLYRCPAALRQSCCAHRDFGSNYSIISSTVPRKSTCHGWHKKKGGQRNQRGWQTREHRWWSLPSICVGDISGSGQVGSRSQPKSGNVRWSLLAAHWHIKNYWGTFYIFHHCLMKARCNYLPFVFTTALEISLKK